MRSLILFIQRHHILFLFLILEGMGFILLFRNNYLQRTAFINATGFVSGNIHEQISAWRDYLHLSEQNRQLQDENIRLRGMLPESFYNADTSRVLNSDLNNSQLYAYLPTGERYAYLPAKVIENTVNRQYNFVILDRGGNNGIEEDMAVIGPEGIVGIVHNVSPHFSTVMPVINRNFRVSVKFKKNNYFGSLAWDGRSYRHATLNEISLHVPVSVGDTLIVSGFSGTFPEGIPVGTVSKVERKDGSFYTIEVLLATDFRKLYYVTVVEDLMIEEIQKLEQQISDMQ